MGPRHAMTQPWVEIEEVVGKVALAIKVKAHAEDEDIGLEHCLASTVLKIFEVNTDVDIREP